MSTTMLETSRTMPNRRASTRLSTYSVTPTLTPSVAPSRLSVAQSDPKHSLDLSSHCYSTEFSRPGNRASYAGPSRVNAAPHAEIDESQLKSLQTRLQRMEDARLQGQRFVVSQDKREELSSLALGAKLERALGRRMSGQDAVFTTKKKAANTEKN